MQAAARQWCNERLTAAIVPWPLLQAFIPQEQHDELLAGQAFVSALVDLVFSHQQVDIAMHKLAWWRQELPRHAESAHPAFIALRESGLGNSWDWSGCDAWCDGLSKLLEMDTPVNQTELWQQMQQLAGQGMQLLQTAVSPLPDDSSCRQSGSDIAAASQIVILANRLSVNSIASRWLPLNLHARYLLQLDQQPVSSKQEDGLELAGRDLLEPAKQALYKAEVKPAEGVERSWLRLLALQRELGMLAARQLQRQSAQIWHEPITTVGPLSAWHGWRAVRRLKV